MTNESVSGNLWLNRDCTMAEPSEPKKETVRIAVTPPPTKEATEGRDTVRITLPTRPPASPPLPAPAPPGAGVPRPPVAKPLIPPAPSRPVQPPRFVPPPPPPPPTSGVPVSRPVPSPMPAVGPKKETARITLLPDPPAPTGVQMKKTQPLIDMPSMAPPPMTPVAVASEPTPVVSAIPMALCWGLLGVSAAILLIQILNYIS